MKVMMHMRSCPAVASSAPITSPTGRWKAVALQHVQRVMVSTGRQLLIIGTIAHVACDVTSARERLLRS